MHHSPRVFLSPRWRLLGVGTVKAIEHKIASRGLRLPYKQASVASSSRVGFSKASGSSPPATFEPSKGGRCTKTRIKCLEQLDTLDDMLENAEVTPIKTYIRLSSLDFTAKLNSIKRLASLDAAHAKEARLRRWRNSRFKRSEERVLTDKQIKEIVGKWRNDMKRFSC
jgi:hypothetical protein